MSGWYCMVEWKYVLRREELAFSGVFSEWKNRTFWVAAIMRQNGKRMEGSGASDAPGREERGWMGREGGGETGWRAADGIRLEKKKGYMIFGEIAPNSKLLRESNG